MGPLAHKLTPMQQQTRSRMRPQYHSVGMPVFWPGGWRSNCKGSTPMMLMITQVHFLLLTVVLCPPTQSNKICISVSDGKQRGGLGEGRAKSQYWIRKSIERHQTKRSDKFSWKPCPRLHQAFTRSSLRSGERHPAQCLRLKHITHH